MVVALKSSDSANLDGPVFLLYHGRVPVPGGPQGDYWLTDCPLQPFPGSVARYNLPTVTTVAGPLGRPWGPPGD